LFPSAPRPRHSVAVELVLGLGVFTSEDGGAWSSFLRGLVVRGLSSVEVVTSDAHAGLKAAIAAVRPETAWQRCRTHFMEVPAEQEVHLILDNYSTHETTLVQRWLLRHPRFHLHFTPTYSSWINHVERVFSDLTEKQLRCGTRQLEAAMRAFLAVGNENPKPFVWVKTADEILASVRRCCERTATSLPFS
jgi:Transposase, Mutator family